MKALRHLFFLIILIASGRAQAQDTIQIRSAALDSLGNTAVLGDSAVASRPVISIWLYNLSGTTFTDTVSFDYSINNTLFHATISDTSGLNFTPVAVTLAPHDSIRLTSIQIHFSRPDFVVGSSTVVIWPIANHTSLVILDSLHHQLTITPPSGITDPELNAIKVYTSGQLLFVKNMGENCSGDIRIYSIDGALISSQTLSQYAQIPMSQYTDGIYIVEINLGDGKKAVYKVANVKDR